MSKSTRKNNVALFELHQVFDESCDGFEATQQVYRDFLMKSTGALGLPFFGRIATCFKTNVIGQWYRCKAVSKICYQLSQADDLSRNIDLSDPYREGLHEDLNARQWNADSYKPATYDGVNPFWYQALYGANVALDFYGLPAAHNFQPAELAWMLGGNGEVEAYTITTITDHAANRVGADIAEGRVAITDTATQDVLRSHYIEEGLFAARAEAMFRRQNVLNAYNYACDHDGEAEALKAIEEGYEGTTWEDLRNTYNLGIANFITKKLKAARKVLIAQLRRPLMSFQRKNFDEALQNIDTILIEYTGGVDEAANSQQAEIDAAIERLKAMPFNIAR